MHANEYESTSVKKNCCVTDSLYSLSGSLSTYIIDLYSVVPGNHTLTIMFNTTTGEEGIHIFNFTGIDRPREFE